MPWAATAVRDGSNDTAGDVRLCAPKAASEWRRIRCVGVDGAGREREQGRGTGGEGEGEREKIGLG